jgi:ribonuclease HI
LGLYKVRTPHLQPLHREIRGLISALTEVKVEHVPRELNKDADRLANLGVDTMLEARRRR